MDRQQLLLVQADSILGLIRSRLCVNGVDAVACVLPSVPLHAPFASMNGYSCLVPGHAQQYAQVDTSCPPSAGIRTRTVNAFLPLRLIAHVTRKFMPR